MPDYGIMFIVMWPAYAVEEMSKRVLTHKTKKDKNEQPPKKQLKESGDTEDYCLVVDTTIPLTTNVYQGLCSGICIISERFQIKSSNQDFDPEMFFLEEELKQLRLECE